MKMLAITIFTLLTIAAGSGPGAHHGAVTTGVRKFDDFGDIKCEDEMARLDNVAIQMQNEPNAKAVLVFFGGTTFRGKIPREGEAAARAARLKPYLVNRRGIAFNRVMVFNGGYEDNWHVEVWIVPLDLWFPAPTPKMPDGGIKFRKGTANAREYRCGI